MARTSASRGKKGFSMKSGNRSNFKMMGSSMAINRSGYGNSPDGRAKSSAFQVDEDDKKKEGYTYGKEQLVKETKSDYDTKKEYETKGIKVDRSDLIKTPEGDAAYAAMTLEQRKAADKKFDEARTSTDVIKRSEMDHKLLKIPMIQPKPLPVETDMAPMEATYLGGATEFEPFPNERYNPPKRGRKRKGKFKRYWGRLKDKISYGLRKTGSCIPGGKGSTDCATFM